MENTYCDKKCDNINCKDKLTELYNMSHRNIVTGDLSRTCGKYTKPFDSQIDDLIDRKIADN